MVMVNRRGSTGIVHRRGYTMRWRWGLLLGLTLLCSALYLLLYYYASTNSLFNYVLADFHNYSIIFTNPFNLFRNFMVSGKATLQKDCCGSKAGDGMPLLTLFTTWVNRDDLKLVRKLTLRNWAQLRPLVRPLLFSNDSVMVEQARQNGWDTLPVSRTAIGVPILKNMYLDAMSRFKSKLYAYANGDILFTGGLLKSLMVILRDLALPLSEHPLLSIGKRTNVNNVTDEEALNFSNISKVAKLRGKLFGPQAEDFFITDSSFPWDSIPEVVVGRVAYDNWLVLHSIHNKYVVVDITETSLAVHQTTRKGNFEGWTHFNTRYNYYVLRRLYKKINFRTGGTDCALWSTAFDSNGTVVVKSRHLNPYCK